MSSNINENHNPNVSLNNENELNEDFDENNPIITTRSHKNLNTSADWLLYFKKAKIDLEVINKALLNNVESIDKENIKLKGVIKELILDLQQKEYSLGQSHKIINKLKDQYTNLIKEYSILDNQNKKLEENIQEINKQNELMIKYNSNYDKILKQNESLKNELEKIKKEKINLKSNLNNKTSEFNKKEKEYNESNILLNDIKSKSENFIVMIKEREKIINECNNKINELTNEIERKDEQLKLMVNFSKNLNNENKSNVKELTKQAVQTIKLFYSNLNKNNDIFEDENSNKIFISDKDDFNLKNLENEIISNKQKCSFKLQEGINSHLFIPNNNKALTKEFLVNMNFKTELLKYELYSSLIREFQIVNFLKEIFRKIEFDNNDESFNNITNKIIILKNEYELSEKGKEKLLMENINLKERIKELDLYVMKMKNDFSDKLKKMKDKIESIINAYGVKIQMCNNKYIQLKNKYLNEITLLKSQINNDNIELSKLKAKLNNNNLNNQIPLQDNYILNNNNNVSFNPKTIDEETNTPNNYFNNDFDKYNSIKNNSISKPISFKLSPSQSLKDIKYQNDFDNEQFNNNYNNSYLNFNSNINSIPQNETIRNNNNESFNEKNYKIKKLENEKLKDEISRLKEEIINLLNEMNKLRENSNNNKENDIQRKCNNCIYTENKINDFINEVPLSQFKDIKRFYLNFEKELKKFETKLLNLITQISYMKQQISSERIEKKNISSVNFSDLINDIQKLLNILSNIYNKNMNDNSSKIPILEKILNFMNNIIYQQIKNESSESDSSTNSDYTEKKKNIDNQLNNVFTKINVSSFSTSELRKFHFIYDNKSLEEIIQIYIEKCETIKNHLNNIKLNFDTELTDNEENYVYGNNKNDGNIFLSSSYKIVNEEIIKLKKKEFEHESLVELIKNFLIAEEIIFKRGKNKEIIYQFSDKIYQIFEQTCNYKIDDFEDIGIFDRKLSIKLLSIYKLQLNFPINQFFN